MYFLSRQPGFFGLHQGARIAILPEPQPDVLADVFNAKETAPLDSRAAEIDRDRFRQRGERALTRSAALEARRRLPAMNDPAIHIDSIGWSTSPPGRNTARVLH